MGTVQAAPVKLRYHPEGAGGIAKIDGKNRGKKYTAKKIGAKIKRIDVTLSARVILRVWALRQYLSRSQGLIPGEKAEFIPYCYSNDMTPKVNHFRIRECVKVLAF